MKNLLTVAALRNFPDRHYTIGIFLPMVITQLTFHGYELLALLAALFPRFLGNRELLIL